MTVIRRWQVVISTRLSRCQRFGWASHATGIWQHLRTYQEPLKCLHSLCITRSDEAPDGQCRAPLLGRLVMCNCRQSALFPERLRQGWLEFSRLLQDRHLIAFSWLMSSWLPDHTCMDCCCRLILPQGCPWGLWSFHRACHMPSWPVSPTCGVCMEHLYLCWFMLAWAALDSL